MLRAGVLTWSCWVGLDGLEPSTSSLSGKRSNRAELQARRVRDIAARHEDKGYRNLRRPQPDARRGQSVSFRVTSIPPASIVTKLYSTAPTVARAVIRMTFTAPTSIV